MPGASTVKMAFRSSQSDGGDRHDMALYYVMGTVSQEANVKDKPREEALEVGCGL